MLSMTGRVTMLGISRWAGRGGSYRSVQRFFNVSIPWPQVMVKFFAQHLYRPAGEYFLVGDESVVTKSGKQTHGLDHFFSGLLSKTVKGIAIFALSLVSVEERHSYPLQVEQVVRSEAEKAAAKARQKKRQAKQKSASKKKPGRPQGSQNRDKTQVELTPELKRIQKMVKNQLAALQNLVTVRYLALDGHFGNNHALQMVLQCGLQLISKLRYDAALYFIYDGQQKRKGPRKKYGQKIIYQRIPKKYLVEQSTQGDICTRIYQAVMLHPDFAQALNVVIITKTNLKTGAFANVNLFSSDLELPYEKIIDFYSLRFQIEIVCTQMTKASVFTTGAGWDDIADFDFRIVNDYSINQQFYQLPALFKVQIIQGWFNSLAKYLDVICQCKGFDLLLSLEFQLSQLLLETVLGSSQFLALALKFVSHDDFCQVHFQETILLTFQACQGLPDGIAFRLQGLWQPFAGLSTFQFMGNQVWLGNNAAEILPDELIKCLGWHITSCTTFAFSGSMNICFSTAFVIVVFSLGPSGRRQMALTATDQTSQKVIVAFIIATRHILVSLQTRLGRIKYFLINDGRNRNLDPLLCRGRLDALASSYRRQGRFAPSCRDWPGTPTVGHANIRRRMQNAPNRGWIPAFTSSRRRDLLFVQLFDNPVHRDRGFRVSIPGKDLPNNGRFDRVNPYLTRISGALRVQDISVRRSGPRQKAPGSKFGLPPTPHSLSNQVAFIFSHRSTDLKQELVVGIILLHWAFQKLDLTTQFFHFLDQQNLMYIFTSQSIRCGYQDQFESGHTGSISQPIQAWPIELGTRVTIVAIHMLWCQFPIGILAYSLLQSFNLLLYALTLHLTVGRYSGIKGDLHDHSPDWVIPGDVVPRSAPSSSAEETDKCNPNEVAHRNILRLYDELAILFSYALLEVVVI
jgi:putative transposase